MLKLSEFDKYRTLHLSATKNQAGNLKLSGLAPQSRVRVSTTIGPLRDDGVLLSVHFPGDKWPFAKSPEEVRSKGPIGVGIVFDKGSPAVAAQDVVGTLRKVSKRVSKSIEAISSDVLGLKL